MSDLEKVDLREQTILLALQSDAELEMVHTDAPDDVIDLQTFSQAIGDITSE